MYGDLYFSSSFLLSLYISIHTSCFSSSSSYMSAVQHILHTSRVKLKFFGKSASRVVTDKGTVPAHKLCVLLKYWNIWIWMLSYVAFCMSRSNFSYCCVCFTVQSTAGKLAGWCFSKLEMIAHLRHITFLSLFFFKKANPEKSQRQYHVYHSWASRKRFNSPTLQRGRPSLQVGSHLVEGADAFPKGPKQKEKRTKSRQIHLEESNTCGRFSSLLDLFLRSNLY